MADSDAGTIASTKFATTHVVYLCLNVVLAIVGHWRGDSAHAFNAMTALYSIALGTLVQSCVQRLDCTWQDTIEVVIGSTESMYDDNDVQSTTLQVATETKVHGGHYSLDVMPDVKCWDSDAPFWVMAAIATVGYALYACVLPGVLFCRLRSGVKAGRITDPEFLR
jgi:hypothetical protein